MASLSQIYSLFALAWLHFAGHEVAALNYVSVDSGDGNFKLQWTYSNNNLIFNMTCKATGWCGVGFTTSVDGKSMVNYDIAVGGFASNTGYLADYWSTSLGQPPKDATQNLNLIQANEAGGYTNVDFDRAATTGDNKDVQFTNNTEVWVVWAWHNTNDENVVLSRHSATGISSKKHNLIAEAMAAQVQPSATIMTSSVHTSPTTTPGPTPGPWPSTTTMTLSAHTSPTTTAGPTPGPTTGPTPKRTEPTNSASPIEVGLCAVAFSFLSLSAHMLSVVHGLAV